MSDQLALRLDSEPQPTVLQARCTPPVHECQRLHMRGFQRCQPVLVVHAHPDHVDMKLFVAKPWELTRDSRLACLMVFEAWGALVPEMVGARISVAHSFAEWQKIPRAIARPFVGDISSHLFFQRIVLP